MQVRDTKLCVMVRCSLKTFSRWRALGPGNVEVVALLAKKLVRPGKPGLNFEQEGLDDDTGTALCCTCPFTVPSSQP